MASSSSGVRSWRTAFLTLRDETLTSPPPPTLFALLRDLVLSQPSDSLVAAASDLPPHEEASLDGFRLPRMWCFWPNWPRLFRSAKVQLIPCFVFVIWYPEPSFGSWVEQNTMDGINGIPLAIHGGICLADISIHDVSCRMLLEFDSSSCTIMLSFLQMTVECSLGISGTQSFILEHTARMKAVKEILDVLRVTVRACGRNNSLSQSTRLIRLLLSVISCFHVELNNLYCSNGTNIPAANTGMGDSKWNGLWDMQIIAFSMIGDGLTQTRSSMPANLWQSVVEVLRKLMDFLALKNLIVENNVMSRFYTTLFNCLHLVLSEPKGSLSEHVAGFVATLQMFFMYGLPSRSSLPPVTTGSKDKSFSSLDMKSGQLECRQNSDHSDSDGPVKEGDHYRSSKVRLAAIVCIQDLCHGDPKWLTSLWTLILPENDVLQQRKYQSTLMTCLIFDPVIRIRIGSATAIASMLDKHSSVLLQVAEYRDASKCGSFTTLSSSLGQKLMQLHTGLLYLIQHETHSGLLTSLFKALMLLISATPYARMPGELLPTVISCLHTRIMENLALKNENIGLLLSDLSCLGTALSKSPPSLHVLKLLEEDASRDFSQVLCIAISSFNKDSVNEGKDEGGEALRAVSHNYPNIVNRFWEQISATVYELLEIQILDDSSSEFVGLCKGEIGKTFGSTMERCIMAGIKVLDECLRAASGFKGADDLLECRLQDIQQISDSSRRKRISSAPSYELDGLEASSNYTADCQSGCEQWNGMIEKHLPKCLPHASPMVRAASVTCFAGMTSAVFFSLTEDKQEFVISSAVTAAVKDAAPSVRSAACRAIGVIACFSQIVSRSKVLNEIICAAEFNTHDPLASVRITASWALANICDSFRHKATELCLDNSAGEVTDSKCISLLAESALRLTKDGDKIKSNAVRALGNLSRFIRFTHHSITNNRPSVSCSTLSGDSQWLERMVQAFVSCVTTGNVKVQWNVCHALSNLFMNDTLKLHDASWAPAVYSILLLLLRDSTNFKIRIHAAVALAVPATRPDYGSSFPDVVQGLENILESLGSDHSSTPSSFRYKDNLEKQLTLTTLRVLGFVSSADDQALKDFLMKLSDACFKFSSGLMAKEYNGSAKINQLGSIRERLTWILGVSGLCVLFYMIGAWQNTTTPSTSNPISSIVSKCNGPTAQLSSSASSLDFQAHHQVGLNESSLSTEEFPSCDLKYGEYTPCQDPRRARKFVKAMLKYRERHCPRKEELLRCLIPAPPKYKNPFKWPQSRDYAWYDNIPHRELSIEKAVQNWIQVEGNRFRFPGGGTMFPRGADSYIDDINALIPLTNGNIRTAIDTGCGCSAMKALHHADGVFSTYQDRCDITYILLEMDRILRPEGTVIFRDTVDVLVKVQATTKGMRWKSQIMDHESGPFNPEKILVAVKAYWTGGPAQQK
ncbi:putative HEAT repeat-containing protein 6 [Cocos nucifera]|uniref:Putative HEAT repeat-containing protein 6 n=1 Tax=Cocos nucifera TaxID=13894 RepID=A0A8K0IJE0_COCNU|nr:putative HEAT repeat-containing protein 6 [Cocos nucifera]